MTQRRHFLQTAGALGASALLPTLARAQSGARKFQGVTLNVSAFSSAYHTLLKQWLPEFEAATGAKVNFDTPSFPVYNQRTDLELSTKGSAYDVVNVTFIYISRWINSGWLTPLDDFIRNPNLTPPDWDVADFLPGARAPETGKDGKLYGIPWVAEALLSGASRFDLVKAAGFGYPDTTDDLVKVLRAVNKKERVAGFVADNHYGWTFVPYLHAFGGDVFRKAPDDLFPTLDTPEAVAAAEYYANLLKEFGPDGAITYQPDQVTQALKSGRVNFADAGQIYLAQLADKASSKVAQTAHFGLLPKGPAGRFPGTAVHALSIPTGSRNKEAAWALSSGRCRSRPRAVPSWPATVRRRAAPTWTPGNSAPSRSSTASTWPSSRSTRSTSQPRAAT
ncbi:ABC transporter substrate-binding protein [Xylophilus sp.]|uniref:ABC transporter substrate-binding protein n=1 Tax=Xylophilus sp. TaxID=2653893 RepID=UPI002D7F36CC|nr:extracellular solute-binding protein [Xylophilus sp.]